MKAIAHDTYGSVDVLEMRDVEQPVPGDHDVVVAVAAASVNPYDWHLVSGAPLIARLAGRSLGFGFRGPGNRVRGWDAAGTVAAIGRDVTGLQPGDEVFGWCDQDGAFAEYVRSGGGTFVAKPANLSFEQSAAVPLAGLTALQALRDEGRVEPGQHVLINGASGGIGTFAVQLAKAFGAEVTGVCSTGNLDLVRSLGADHVVDYTTGDFTRNGVRYDLMVDSAVSRTLAECRRALTPEGTYVVFGDSGGHWVGGFRRVLQMRLAAPFVRQEMRSFVTAARGEDLIFLRELIEAGTITPVIDRTYPLAETPAALAYLEHGHARGKVVITV